MYMLDGLPVCVCVCVRVCVCVCVCACVCGVVARGARAFWQPEVAPVRGIRNSYMLISPRSSLERIVASLRLAESSNCSRGTLSLPWKTLTSLN